jgi:hypothetical protein
MSKQLVKYPRRTTRDRRSDRHKRYQAKLAGILREYGFQSVATEKGLPYYLPLRNGQVIKIRYRVDVYGRKGNRRLAIEIDGYMGHKSQRAVQMDGLRTRRLSEAYELERVYRFTFSQLAQWTEKEIAEEMRL